jgi:hypothetical protein
MVLTIDQIVNCVRFYRRRGINDGLRGRIKIEKDVPNMHQKPSKAERRIMVRTTTMARTRTMAKIMALENKGEMRTMEFKVALLEMNSVTGP